MSAYGIGIARAPNLLLSRLALSDIGRTNVSLYAKSSELSTGTRLSAPSQDAVASAAVTTLDARLERSEQRLRNLDFANSSLDTLDSALGEASDLLEEAKSLSISQLNITTTATERESQAIIVDQMLESLFRTANSTSLAGYVFGGTQPGVQPVENIGGVYKFSGERNGITPDLGFTSSVPITLGALNSIGSVSSRVQGFVDFEPLLTRDTRIVDLRGAESVGVEVGNVLLEVNEDDPMTIDLSDADTIGDVLDKLTQTIRAYEDETGETVLGPDGVTFSGTSIEINPAPDVELAFFDQQGGTTARDLGLRPEPTNTFTDTNELGQSLSPKVTMRTPITALSGINTDLGRIRLSNMGRTVTVDLSQAETVGDIRSLIESTGLGVRVELNADQTALNVVSEISGGSNQSLSIADAGDSTGTASALGITTLSRATPISDLNFGSGVSILEGDPDNSLNEDFKITLGDGFEIPINLTSADITTAGSLVDALNEAINTALTDAGRPTTDLNVTIATTQNGFAFNQAPTIGGAVSIQQRNNSPAAIQLGLLDATWDGANNRLVSEDRAKVRVDSLFSHLIDLRDSLQNDDTFGIELASASLDRMVKDVAETRALVGGYSRRVSSEVTREEERSVLDSTFRSQLRDTDFATAASEFSLLQTQLQAGLQVAAISGQLSLLNYIG